MVSKEMFENVDKQTDGCRLESFVYYYLTSELSALVSLKRYFIRPCMKCDLHFVGSGAYSGQFYCLHTVCFMY